MNYPFMPSVMLGPGFINYTPKYSLELAIAHALANNPLIPTLPKKDIPACVYKKNTYKAALGLDIRNRKAIL